MKSFVNSIALFAANAATALASYVIVILIARSLGAASFGDYAFAVAYGGLFVTLPNFGLDRIFIREASRQRSAAGQYLAAAGAVRLTLTVAALGLAVLIAGLLGYSARLQNLIVIFFISLALNLFSELFRSMFYAFEAMPYETLVRAVGRIVTVAGVAIAINRGAGLAGVGWALAATALLELLIYASSALLRFKPQRVRVSRELSAAMVRASLPIAVNTTLVVIYFKINVVILTTLKGAQVAGWFGAAFVFLQLLQVVSGSVAGVALPVMSRQFQSSGGRLLASLNKAVYYLMAAAFPLALSIAAMAPQLIGLIYGNQYLMSVQSLRIIIWASVFMFLGSIYSTALIALNKQAALVWMAAGAVVINVALNFLLIPSFSLVGSSVVTVITEACVALFAFFLVRKALPRASMPAFVLKPLTAALVMALTFWALGDVHWMLRLASGCLAYAVTLILVRGIPKEDLQALRNSIRLKRLAKNAV